MGPQVRVVIVEVAQFPPFGVGAEPAAAPVGKLINRREKPRFFAEAPRVLFCVIVFFQQRYFLGPVQPQQAVLLVTGDSNVPDRPGRKRFLVAFQRLDLAIPLDGALAAQGEGTHHAFPLPSGHPPGEQPHIGLLRAEHHHLHPHPLQGRDSGAVDEVPVLRHLAGDVPVKHDLTVHRLIQRFAMLFGQQNGR